MDAQQPLQAGAVPVMVGATDAEDPALAQNGMSDAILALPALGCGSAPKLIDLGPDAVLSCGWMAAIQLSRVFAASGSSPWASAKSESHVASWLASSMDHMPASAASSASCSFCSDSCSLSVRWVTFSSSFRLAS